MSYKTSIAFGAFATIATLAVSSPAAAAIAVSATAPGYAQDFNSLPNTNGSDPAWANDSSLAGWSIFSGPRLDTPVSNLRVSTSSGSDRAHISYGLNGAADRAFGSQGGSSHRYSPVTPAEGESFGAIAVAFVNSGNEALAGFSFSYTGEQWYVSSNANTAHSLTMAWAIGAADTAFDALAWQSFTAAQSNAAGASFVTPVTSGGTSGNGNLAENRTIGLGASVTGLDWQPGQRVWLRWVDINDPASDHGMAIDDFTFLAAPVPETGTLPMLAAGLAALAVLRCRHRQP